MSQIKLAEIVSSSAYLIWEDADKETWWLSRCHADGGLYIVAPDSVTDHVLVLHQPEGKTSFKVIAAIRTGKVNTRSVAIAEAKRRAVRWLGDPLSAEIKSGVRTWCAQRWSTIALRELPLALVSVLIGSILAFIVAAFFIVTEIAGWPMVLIGTLLGLSSGWLLKWAADRKFSSFMGPMSRFWTVTGSATLGAFLTVLLFFILFPGT